jgi:hypothetical protein
MLKPNNTLHAISGLAAHEVRLLQMLVDHEADNLLHSEETVDELNELRVKMDVL